jgi:hypothetical protein
MVDQLCANFAQNFLVNPFGMIEQISSIVNSVIRFGFCPIIHIEHFISILSFIFNLQPCERPTTGWPTHHNGRDSRALNRWRFGGVNNRSVH